VEWSWSLSNLLHWLKFIVQSRTQVPSEVKIYIGTTHVIISDYSQFITITCPRLSPFSHIQQQCIMLKYFCNHCNNFRVLFPWKLGVRGRRHTDMVLVGKVDKRNEAMEGIKKDLWHIDWQGVYLIHVTQGWAFTNMPMGSSLAQNVGKLAEELFHGLTNSN